MNVPTRKTIPQALAEVLAKAAILKKPAIRRIMSKNPDAEWSVELPPYWAPERMPRVYGRINLEYVRDNEDIRDICNGADSDSWTLEKTLIDREVSRVKVQLTLTASQRYTRDEIETLKGLGKLVEQTYTPSSYVSLVCSR